MNLANFVRCAVAVSLMASLISQVITSFIFHYGDPKFTTFDNFQIGVISFFLWELIIYSLLSVFTEIRDKSCFRRLFIFSCLSMTLLQIYDYMIVHIPHHFFNFVEVVTYPVLPSFVLGIVMFKFIWRQAPKS